MVYLFFKARQRLPFLLTKKKSCPVNSRKTGWNPTQPADQAHQINHPPLWMKHQWGCILVSSSSSRRSLRKRIQLTCTKPPPKCGQQSMRGHMKITDSWTAHTPVTLFIRFTWPGLYEFSVCTILIVWWIRYELKYGSVLLYQIILVWFQYIP